MQILPLSFQTAADELLRRDTILDRAVIAGWTGRDEAAVEKHIVELEALGVRRPATTPIFYRVAAARLTTESRIEVLGSASSGEVEFVLLRSAGRLWVGVGSDHTDREVETYGVSVSKQMCDKPLAPNFWPFEDVEGHWDRLTLRSYAWENGQPRVYQEGAVSAMLEPRDLMARFAQAGGFAADGGMPEATLMFCGTLPVQGGIRGAERFGFELNDPVLGRKIQHAYDIMVLPILG